MSEKQRAAENSDMADEKQMQETALLSGADKYGIYQLRDDPELSRLRFKGTWSLKQAGILKENAEAVAVKPENYDLVYVGDLSELKAKTAGLYTQEDTLHALFEKFNIYQPGDYTGHPLSKGDIVVLREDGKNTAHYVDTTGYTEMPHFIRMLENRREKEQETDRARSEGRVAGKESLKEKLAGYKNLSADVGKDHPTRKQQKEMSL
mgnify:CR=1 FL=1